MGYGKTSSGIARVAGNFTKQSNGNGGTLITDPPIGQYSLYNPHA